MDEHLRGMLLTACMVVLGATLGVCLGIIASLAWGVYVPVDGTVICWRPP